MQCFLVCDVRRQQCCCVLRGVKRAESVKILVLQLRPASNSKNNRNDMSQDVTQRDKSCTVF
jgi:hypothetical protein